MRPTARAATWITDRLSGRDALPSPYRMIGFPSDGGLATAGVTSMTSLAISSVWRCLDVISNGVSQLDWCEKRAGMELPPSRLVRRPQSQRTRREWTSLVVSTLALYDVCYLWKIGGDDAEGVPMALWPLDPSIVQPIYTDLYNFLPPNEFYVQQIRVSRDELVILHRSPQPTIQDTFGGVLRLARATFAAAIAAENYASRYWQAGGSANTYLTTDATLTDTAAEGLSERWRERRARGPDYAPVLSGGLKAQQTGADPTTESAVEARRELVADVGRYFGLPTRILNAPTGDTQTYHNAEAANQDLVRYTLMNYVNAIEDGISDQLPGGRYMEMQTDVLTRGVQFDRAQSWALALGQKPWLTPADVRAQEGFAPLEDPSSLDPAPSPTTAAPAPPAILPGPLAPVPALVAGGPYDGI